MFLYDIEICENMLSFESQAIPKRQPVDDVSGGRKSWSEVDGILLVVDIVFRYDGDHRCIGCDVRVRVRE